MEYVIWGIPPGQTDEVVLVASYGGKQITDKKIASKIAEWATKRGASSVRIQEVDLSTPPDFGQTLNLK